VKPEHFNPNHHLTPMKQSYSKHDVNVNSVHLANVLNRRNNQSE